MAEVCLDMRVINHYKEFEDSSNGLVKLFRVAKNKLKGLFAAYDDKEEPKALPLFHLVQFHEPRRKRLLLLLLTS